MNLIKNITNLFKHKNKNKISPSDTPVHKKFETQAIYQVYDFTNEDINELVIDMIKPAQTFIENISLQLSAEDQTIYCKIDLKSFFKPLSFNAKLKFIDIWQDSLTSSIVFDIIEIDVHLISLLPKKLHHWCGKKLISLISVLASILQPKESNKSVRFYLQENSVYVDFHPWLQSYFDGTNQDHWLNNFFAIAKDDYALKGKRYLKNHIIFSAEIHGTPAMFKTYLYRMPASFYNENFIDCEEDFNISFFGNWLEWSFAVVTSFYW